MELENFFKITLNNGNEMILNDNSGSTRKLLTILSDGLVSSEFIALRRIKVADREPIFFRKSAIFSVEQISTSTIGNNDKIWRIEK